LKLQFQKTQENCKTKALLINENHQLQPNAIDSENSNKKKPVPEIPDDGYKKSNFYSFFFRFFRFILSQFLLEHGNDYL
jgi:hypothetical protein